MSGQRRLARLTVASAVALALAACSKPADDGAAGRPIAPPAGQPGAPAVGGEIPSTQQVLPDGGAFTLTGVDGKPFALASLRGRPVILFFGYTSCPDFCPRAMGTVRAALARLDAAARTRVATVFVSVDPERDTPKVLGRYLQHFGLGAIGATGTHDQLHEIIKRYGADYERESSATPEAYTVSHPTSLYVIAPDGRLRAIVSSADEVDELLAALRRVQ